MPLPAAPGTTSTPPFWSASQSWRLTCAAAARAAGEPWRDALAIGVLMNARGLMELIILNIGLERGDAREPAGARPSAA